MLAGLESRVENPTILCRMQSLLARLYDAHIEHEPQEFLVSDRRRLAALLGPEAANVSDEHVFIVPGDDGVRVGLFIDREVLDRLSQHDPLEALSERNLQDFCTALEGVSHFHYLLWSLGRGRGVSLLELELQAEVDKYASALALLIQQRGEFPHGLHAAMFDRVRYVPELDPQVRRRYEEANRHAARYCRSLDERFLRRRRSRPEAWVAELRQFFRFPHQQKLLAASR
ncbi:MAG TPA: hypothetical protein VIL28_14530 [Steroidobacteraceae bacterium]